MIKIAKDTPPQLLKLAKEIDFSKVPASEVDGKIAQLKHVAEKYNIPRRTSPAIAIEVDMPGCPQKLATLISQMDFSSYSAIIRGLAIGYMRNWLSNNNLLRK